jgi:putative transposase
MSGQVGEHVTRAVVFTLDATPAQDRMLRSYCGAARFAYNWTLDQVTENMATRAAEREAGGADETLTPALSWSSYRLRTQFNGVKPSTAPWAGEVAKHCFDTGINQAADALANWSASRKGTRAGARVGFPRYKSRKTAKLSVSFVELNHQLSWFHDSRHGVRLILPQALLRSKDRHVRAQMQHLVWLHTVESTRRLYRLVEQERASIQKVTISYTGGRWQSSFLLRYQLDARPLKRGHARIGGAVGVDLGLAHLATLSKPVPELTDSDGHVANPRPLAVQLDRLQDLDRKIARCQDGSKNRVKLVRRRARLHGRIAKTRKAAHHQLANELAARFDLVGVENLNVKGMTHNRPLARSLADAGLGQLAQLISTEAADRATPVVTVGRWFASSKTCSGCGTVKAKLSLSQRTFDCTHCGMSVDRDVNAAHNIEREATRLLAQQRASAQLDVAGLRPETRNADRRTHKTSTATAAGAVFVDGRTRQSHTRVA